MQRLAELRVGEGESFLDVLSKNILWQRFNQRMIEPLGIAHFLLCLLALGDVFHRAFVIQ